MKKNKVTWEEVIQKFDLFEKQLDAKVYDAKSDDFFTDIIEDFTNGNFEQTQIQEAKNRMILIQHKIKQLRQDLLQRSNDLLTQKSQFDSYHKAMYINKRN